MVNGIHNAFLPPSASIADSPDCLQGNSIKIALEKAESIDKVHPNRKKRGREETGQAALAVRPEMRHTTSRSIFLRGVAHELEAHHQQ
jgi:hypothetical protein